jgi:hypothetical protein
MVFIINIALKRKINILLFRIQKNNLFYIIIRLNLNISIFKFFFIKIDFLTFINKNILKKPRIIRIKGF